MPAVPKEGPHSRALAGRGVSHMRNWIWFKRDRKPLEDFKWEATDSNRCPEGSSHWRHLEEEDAVGLRISHVHKVSQADRARRRAALVPRKPHSLLRKAAKWVRGQISAATPPPWVLGQSHRTSAAEWKWSLPLKCADNSDDQATDEGQDISAQLMFSTCWRNSHWKCRHWQSLLSSWFLGTWLRILNLKMP